VLRFVVLIAVVTATQSSCASPPDERPFLPALLIDSVTGVMPSNNPDVVLLRMGFTCTPDTYLHKVHCFEGATRAWRSFGREGSGPGEFRSVGSLARVAANDSAIGVVDLRQARLSVIDLNGTYQSSFPLPSLFRPLSEVGPRDVLGAWLGFEIPETLTGRVVRLDINSGTPLQQITIEEETVGDERPMWLLRGAESEDGTLVFHITGFRFARYTSEGVRIANLELPTELQIPIYPSRRDREVYAYGLRQLFGQEPHQDDVEEYATRPRNPVVSESSIRRGPDRTTWVASARDRIRNSYLDVFQDDGYLGTVQVRHRLLGYDILDDLLVVLVERPQRDEYGWVRGFDWYRIGSLNR
jgi:hypothetical protein